MRVVIVGGDAAGMSCAAKLRRNLRKGAEITVFEKTDTVSYSACGLPYYVAGQVQNIESLVARRPADFTKIGIDLRLGHEVTAIDTGAKTVRGVTLGEGAFCREYDKLVVATGAAPRKIAPFDTPRENLYTVRTLQDATRLRAALEAGAQRVVVVGGGFVGLEIAAACRAQGKEVTVVEAAARVLPQVDCELGGALEQELAVNGVAVKNPCRVASLALGGARITGVELDREGNREHLPCDLVVNCVGVRPVTDFIPGVDKLPNGAIKVDETMRTSAPDVYAGGDCSAMQSFVTGEYQYTPLGSNANKQGRVMADVLAGKPAPAFKLLGSSALRLFGLDVAKVGLSEQEATALGLVYKTALVHGNASAGYYGADKITVKLVYRPDDKRLLGAQLVGAGGVVPRANYYALAMANGVPMDEFGYTDLCYSPPFSGVWDVTLVAAGNCR